MVTTHPIQYQVPWLRMLGAQSDIDLHVFFAMIPDEAEQGREFGVAFAWDMPLLDGYAYTVLENQSRNPTLTAWSGCDTPGIAHELKRGGFDAVIVNGWGSKTAVQALMACRWLNIPCIVRGEANGLSQRSLLKRSGHRVLLRMYKSFLAIGKHNRRYYESLGVPTARIFDTPYCVDNARFAGQADAVRSRFGRAELRAAMGLEAETPTFVFSGKFVEKKHPRDAVEALRALNAKGQHRAQLLMVGDGPLREELQRAAEGLPVVFTGFMNQSEIGRAYVASDCLVLPSDAGETWGLVVNEAMASGLPALVSDQVGCAEDLVETRVTGQVFPCRDVKALSDCMGELSADPARLESMGRSARSLVEQHYSFERVVEGAMRALHSVGAS